VITDSGAAKPAIPVIPDPPDPNCNPNPENLSNKGKAKATSKPANENEVITDSAVLTGPSACEPYREAIDLGINRGRNAMAIWQDLVSEYGFASSYQSVQRFVRKRRGTQTPEARVVIVTAAGQEAQVDYGTGPMVRDPESRKYRRTRLARFALQGALGTGGQGNRNRRPFRLGTRSATRTQHSSKGAAKT
jgi:hypothetical protein